MSGEHRPGPVTIRVLGDAAVQVSVVPRSETDPDEAAWALAQEIAHWLRQERRPGVSSVIGTYRDVLIEVDPAVADPRTIAEWIGREHPRYASRYPLANPRIFDIEVDVTGSSAPDLDLVAVHLSRSPGSVLAGLSGSAFTVRAYTASGSVMGDSPLRRPDGAPTTVPRRDNPRTVVPTGSLALAGRQIMVFAASVPSGWNLIGRARLPHTGAPVAGIGDTVRISVTANEDRSRA